jgi:hypothetical protein
VTSVIKPMTSEVVAAQRVGNQSSRHHHCTELP